MVDQNASLSATLGACTMAATAAVANTATIKGRNRLSSTQAFANADWTARGSVSITDNAAPAPVVGMASLIAGLQGAGTADFYYAGYSTTGRFPNNGANAALVLIRRVSTSGTLIIQSAIGASNGKWTVNMALLSDNWETLTATHAAVTVNNAWVANSAGSNGPNFFSTSGVLSFYLGGVHLEPGGVAGAYEPQLAILGAGITGAVQPAAQANDRNVIPNADNVTAWVGSNVTAAASSTTFAGKPMGLYTVTAGGNVGTVVPLSASFAVSAGQAWPASWTLQAVGSITTNFVGIIGNASTWGLNADSTARIVSGPGAITQSLGGLWVVSGLSTTTPTTVEIVRTFRQAENMGLRAYIHDTSGGTVNTGDAALFARPQLERGGVSGAYSGGAGATPPSALATTAQSAKLQGKNMLVWSERPSLWTGQNNFTVTDNSIAAPGGAMTGCTLALNAGTFIYTLYQTVAAGGLPALPATSKYTNSLYFKKLGWAQRVRLIDSTVISFASSVLSVVSGPGGLVDAGDGWYRFVAGPVNGDGTAGQQWNRVRAQQNDGSETFTGNPATDTIGIWGGMLNEGVQAAPYERDDATVAATLGAATLTGTGAIAVSSSLVETLGRATLTGTGAVTVSASLVETLAPATLSAVGAEGASASLVETLAPSTVVIAGTLAISAGLTATLGRTTLGATGALAIGASLAQTLGPSTVVSIASATIAAGLGVTLGPTTVAGAGQASIAAGLNEQLGPMTMVAAVSTPPIRRGQYVLR